MTRHREPLRHDDYVFEASDLPGWVPGPLRRVALDLTYDEAHAFELGLSGLALGTAYAAGHADLVLPLLVGMIAVAFGLKKAPDDKPVAQRVIRKEPWYFSLSLLGSTVLGAGTTSAMLVT